MSGETPAAASGTEERRGARAFLTGIVCAVAACVATFVDVIGVPVVGGEFKVSFLQIAPYIGQLNEQFGPWLPQMMQAPAGSNMSFLLGVGSPALYVISALALLAIPALAAFTLLRMRGFGKVARVCGVAGFAASMVAPLVLVVAQVIVNGQFACGVFEPTKILSVLPSAYLWIAVSVVGVVAVVLSTKGRKAVEQRSESDE